MFSNKVVIAIKRKKNSFTQFKFYLSINLLDIFIAVTTK